VCATLLQASNPAASRFSRFSHGIAFLQHERFYCADGHFDQPGLHVVVVEDLMPQKYVLCARLLLLHCLSGRHWLHAYSALAGPPCVAAALVVWLLVHHINDMGPGNINADP